jgi:glycosyltransferase involved in cell wall biosynthesis
MGVFERRLIDLFIPVSTSVAEGVGLLTSGLPFEVIPNFVPDDVAATASRGHPALAGLPDRYLLYVGALGRHKGVQVLLGAYQRLKDPLPLVMLGMPWADMPKEFPPGVVVIQNVPHPAVMEALTRSVALLVPSIYRDACPTVAMEAMASGKPVIASDIGGLSDIVSDRETGLLLAPGDAGQLAQAIERLTADGPERDRMGAAGRERVTLFQASSVIERVELAYQRLIDQGAATA